MAQDQRAGEGPAESVAAKILRVPTAAQMWAWFSWFSLPVAKLLDTQDLFATTLHFKLSSAAHQLKQRIISFSLTNENVVNFFDSLKMLEMVSLSFWTRFSRFSRAVVVVVVRCTQCHGQPL